MNEELNPGTMALVEEKASVLLSQAETLSRMLSEQQKIASSTKNDMTNYRLELGKLKAEILRLTKDLEPKVKTEDEEMEKPEAEGKEQKASSVRKRLSFLDVFLILLPFLSLSWLLWFLMTRIF